MDQAKIYGVQFPVCGPDNTAVRLADARFLQNDCVVENEYRNGGKNDFDDAYPWGAIRLCCVTVRDGKRTVIYDDDPRFTRDGSAGNVMVEIPRFYFRRAFTEDTYAKYEQWYISGVCHEGFQVDAAFSVGGKLLDKVYVGVYDATAREGGIFSSSYGFADTHKSFGTFAREFAGAGYLPFDLATLQMLQKLLVVEFGTRNYKKYLGGIGAERYFARLRDSNRILAMEPGRVTVSTFGRNLYHCPGTVVAFGHKAHEKNLIRRTVTKIEVRKDDPDLADIWYEGEDIARNGIRVKEDACYGTHQANGHTDRLPYHTGRCDYSTPYIPDNLQPMLNPFRYRWIENLWGNVWEYLAGLRVHKLRYFFTTEPSQYDAPISEWKTVNYPAPLQPNYGTLNSPIWMLELGFDPAHPDMMLPDKCGPGAQGAYYDAAFFSFWDTNYDGRSVDPDTAFYTVVGGGYDHCGFLSPFTYRCTILDSEANCLYGGRIILR